MGKKSKSSKKRAERRERAKTRPEGGLNEELMESQESEADEAVSQAAKAVPETKPEREKKAQKPSREDEKDNPWEKLKHFFGDVKIEALKINWPTPDETWKSTWVTVFVIIVLSVFMGLCSLGFREITDWAFGAKPGGLSSPASVPTAPVDTQAAPLPEDSSGDTGGTE